MKPVNRLGAASVLAAALLVALAGPVLADVAPTAAAGSGSARSAVFVKTDNTVGNEIVAYHRDNAGRLTEAAAYPTGGRGGILAGSVVDHLASQGSLALDEPVGLLIAVNAGSNSISVFGVHGDRLGLRQVLSSGGAFPVSVAIRGDLAYVLNAEDGGSVQGYRIGFGGLLPLPGSARVRTLFRILVNRARSAGSRERRSHAVGDLAAHSIADVIRLALVDSPERQREVVTLRDIDGLSSADVCAVLAITEANQRVLLHRGRSRLRQPLETEFGRA